MAALARVSDEHALVGLYAVISHLVAQSIREIGVRIALGASRMGVLRTVRRQALGAPAIRGLLLSGSDRVPEECACGNWRDQA